MSAPPTSKTLQRLYLTLFLRGRSSRGLNKDRAPATVGAKLWGTLALYALMGLVAFLFRGQPPFGLSLYLHGATLLFLGMFVASSAGEILFQQDAAEILLHRPVDARTVLRAKVAVLVRVSLWLAGAFNLAGLGIGAATGGPPFIPAHLVSTVVAALFCTGSVVLLYQLCLRWFGRERLDNLMTAAQVLLAVGLVGVSQLTPFLLRGMEDRPDAVLGQWWVYLLPPAWFAGLDEVLGGRPTVPMAVLGATALAVTAGVLALAFGKLAAAYEDGLRTLAESRPRPTGSGGKRRWFDRLADVPPLSLALRQPVTRAVFRLCAAYLTRDRDLKLRLYPGIAPMLALPLVFLLQGSRGGGVDGFGFALASGYTTMIPLMALGLLQFSQHWQAADLYRLAPVPGPGPFILGAVAAVVVCLVAPAVLLLVGMVLFCPGGSDQLPLLLPGLLALPVFSLIPGVLGRAVPLSKPTEEAKSATRGVAMFLVMTTAMIIPGIGIAARHLGVFVPFLFFEAVVAALLCALLLKMIGRKRWEPDE